MGLENILNIAGDKLVGAANQIGGALPGIIGGAVGLGKTLYGKPGQRRIISDRVRLRVRTQNGKSVNIGEFDSFSATQQDSIRKFKPCGETRELQRYSPGGYDISIAGGKVDWSLARHMNQQELFVNKHSSHDLPLADQLLEAFTGPIASKAVLISPLFEIEQTFIYYDGSVETYIYEDVTFYNYAINIDSDLSEVKEAVKAFSPRKKVSGETFYLSEILNPTAAILVQNMVTDLQKNRYNITKN